jgi:hypothetical protein
MILIALVSALLSELGQRYELLHEEGGSLTVRLAREQEPDLLAKIQILTKSLNTAAESIGQIETEIKQRQELVAQLEKQADTASKIATL